MQKKSQPQIFDVDLYGLAAVIALVGLGWLLLIGPLEQKLSLQDEEQLQVIQENESVRAELENLEQRVQQKESLVQGLNQTRDIFMNSEGIPEVVRIMGGLTQQCEIRLDEIMPSQPEENKFYRKTRLSLRLYGSFTQLHDLLHKMVRQLKTVRIYSLVIANRSSQRDQCEISLNMDLFTLH
jgi:Tfp pilus assembly protein PilO